jgi:TolA-binding protein
MINLEQVKLLEAKVAKAVEYVERLTKENVILHQKEAELQARLDSNQGRVDELEVLLTRFREEQGQIEEGILAALDKLSQFEKEMEKSLKEKPSGFHAAATKAAARETPRPQRAAVRTAQNTTNAAVNTGPDNGQTCFEIPEDAHGDDIPDPLGEKDAVSSDSVPTNSGSSSAKGEELDIF